MAAITEKLKYQKGSSISEITLYDDIADVGSDYLQLQVSGETVFAALGDPAAPNASDMRIQKGGSIFAVMLTAALPMVNMRYSSLASGRVDVGAWTNAGEIVLGASDPDKDVVYSNQTDILTDTWYFPVGLAGGNFTVDIALDTFTNAPLETLFLFRHRNPATDSGYGIMKSIDGGANWSNVGSVHDPFFAPLALNNGCGSFFGFAIDSNGIAVGFISESGTNAIMRSTDGCVTWTQVASNYVTALSRGSAKFFRYLPNNDMFVLTCQNHLVSFSVDAGLTWNDFSVPATLIRNVKEHGTDIYLSGQDASGGKIWKSTNGGATWTEFYVIPDTVAGEFISDIEILDTTHFIYGSNEVGGVGLWQAATIGGRVQLDNLSQIGVPRALEKSGNMIAIYSIGAGYQAGIYVLP